jgi:hypothetical protein
LRAEFAFREKFKAETCKVEPPRASYKFSNGQLTKKQLDKKTGTYLTVIDHSAYMKQLVDALFNPSDNIQSNLSRLKPSLSDHNLGLLGLHK